jgi:hypothetical protein
LKDYKALGWQAARRPRAGDDLPREFGGRRPHASSTVRAHRLPPTHRDSRSARHVRYREPRRRKERS